MTDLSKQEPGAHGQSTGELGGHHAVTERPACTGTALLGVWLLLAVLIMRVLRLSSFRRKLADEAARAAKENPKR